MKKIYYHCEVYKYDEYDKNRIHEARVTNVKAYTARLDKETPSWDEIEIRTEPDTPGVLFGEVEEGKLLGKYINPNSKYVRIFKG